MRSWAPVEVRKLACANCGAGLEIPSGVRFVTCAYCSTALEVRESEHVFFTTANEKLGAIKEDTGRTAAASERVADELELGRLEREVGELRVQVKALVEHHTRINSERAAEAARAQEEYEHGRARLLEGLDSATRLHARASRRLVLGLLGLAGIPVVSVVVSVWLIISSGPGSSRFAYLGLTLFGGLLLAVVGLALSLSAGVERRLQAKRLQQLNAAILRQQRPPDGVPVLAEPPGLKQKRARLVEAEARITHLRERLRALSGDRSARG